MKDRRRAMQPNRRHLDTLINLITFPAVGACFVYLIFTLATMEAVGQETVYTKCVNNKGEVVIVTNFTCPAGFWPVN